MINKSYEFGKTVLCKQNNRNELDEIKCYNKIGKKSYLENYFSIFEIGYINYQPQVNFEYFVLILFIILSQFLGFCDMN